MEAMGGRIKAESPAVRRRGARLIVAFPIAKEAVKEPARDAS